MDIPDWLRKITVPKSRIPKETIPEHEFDNFDYIPTNSLFLLLCIVLRDLKRNDEYLCHIPEFMVYEGFGLEPRFVFPDHFNPQDPVNIYTWFAIRAKDCLPEARRYVASRLKTDRRYTLIPFYTFSTHKSDVNYRYVRWLCSDEPMSQLPHYLGSPTEGHLSVFLVDHKEKTISYIDALEIMGNLPNMEIVHTMEVLFTNIYPGYNPIIHQFNLDAVQLNSKTTDFCVPMSLLYAKDLMKPPPQETGKRRRVTLAERYRREVFDIIKYLGYDWDLELTSFDADKLLTAYSLKQLNDPPLAREVLCPGQTIPLVTAQLRRSKPAFPQYTFGGFITAGDYEHVI